MVTIVAWVAMMFTVPRPVIASFVLLAAFVVVLGHPERLGWTLVPLTWLWAAVHGLFVLGLALVALEALRRRSWRLFGLGVLAGMAALFTAHGIGVIGILLDFLDNRAALGFLSEWKRPDFVSPGLAPTLVVAAALVAAFWPKRVAARYVLIAGPFDMLDRYGLDQALVKTSWDIDRLLAERGWREAYRDERWAVHVRP